MSTTGSQDIKKYSTRPKRNRSGNLKDDPGPSIELLFEETVAHLIKNPNSEIFQNRVTNDIAPGYSDIVKNPMDLNKVIKNLQNGDYSIQNTGSIGDSIKSFLGDINLIFSNCFLYNPEGHWVRKCGESLKKSFETYWHKNVSKYLSDNSYDYIEKKKSYKNNSKNSASAPKSEKLPKEKSKFIDSSSSFFRGKSVDLNYISANKSNLQPIGKSATDLLAGTQLPLLLSYYTISNFGTICPLAGFHNKDNIYPVGYRSSYARMILLDKWGKGTHFQKSNSNKTMKQTQPINSNTLVPLATPSKVVIHYNCTITNNMGNVDFCVYLADMLISRGSNPSSAWENAEKVVDTVILMILWNLKRCKAVLNLLCCHPDISAFLEDVNESEAPGYKETIRRPMSMRTVDENLKSGCYVNEFAFASDVRLIFRNAKQYNAEGSSLWLAANSLSKEFERLFLTWVISPRARSGANIPLYGTSSPPNGPWDSWEVLRYFDAVPGCAKCARTGTPKQSSSCQSEIQNIEVRAELEESLLPFCRCCEDRWHGDCLPRGIELVPEKDFESEELTDEKLYNFLCPRCIDAAEIRNIAEMKSKKGGGDGGKLSWRPVPEKILPLGFYEEGLGRPEWRDSSQRLFLTTSGIVVTGLRTAQNLSAVYASLCKDDLEPSKSVAGMEDLSPSSHYLTIFGLKPKKTVELVHHMKQVDPPPRDGYFCLERTEVRKKIEELPGVESLIYYGAHMKMKNQVEAKIGTKENDQTISQSTLETEEILRHALREERGFWRDHRLRRADGAFFVSNEPTKNEQYSPVLLPPIPLVGELSSKGQMIEKLLYAWEYINTFSSELGFLPVSIEKAIAATLLRSSDLNSEYHDPLLPPPDSIIFEEACIVLTKVLLLEVQYLGGQGFVPGVLTGKTIREILALKPMNLLTWPEHAAQFLAAICVKNRHSLLPAADVTRIIIQAPKGYLLRCADILCVLMVHPLIDPFMEPVDPNVFIGYNQAISVPMDLHHIRVRLWGGRNIPRYSTHREFANDIRLMWTNARTFHRPGNSIRVAAEVLSTLFERLYRVNVTDIEDEMVKKHSQVDDAAALLADRHIADDLDKAARMKAEAAEQAAAEAQAINAAMPAKVVSKAALALRASRAAKAAAAAAEVAEKAAKAATMWEGTGDNDSDVDRSESENTGNSQQKDDESGKDFSDKYERSDVKYCNKDSGGSDTEFIEDKECANISSPACTHPVFGTKKIPAKCKGSIEPNSTHCHPCFFGRMKFLPVVEEYCTEVLTLDSVINSLRHKNPWEWSPSDRVEIISVLTREILYTEMGRTLLSKKSNMIQTDVEISGHLEQIEYPEDAGMIEPSIDDELKPVCDSIPKKSSTPQISWCSVCFGSISDHSDRVTLPSVILEHPEAFFQKSETDTGLFWQKNMLSKVPSLNTAGSTMKNNECILVAHRSCCKALWRARWLARIEEQQLRCYEEKKLKSNMSSLSLNNVESVQMSKIRIKSSNERDQDSENFSKDYIESIYRSLGMRQLLRTHALGRDHYGNQYWKIFGDTSQVLICQHGTLWGVYKGSLSLQKLIAALNPDMYLCEYMLRIKMYGTLDVWGLENILDSAFSSSLTNMETSAFIRKRELDIWKRVEVKQTQYLFETFKAWKLRRVPAAPVLSPSTALAAQQLVFARMVERRLQEYMCVYSTERQVALASTNELDSARKERNKWQKEWSEQWLDYHPEKGWVRLDSQSIMKELVAETSATRLLYNSRLLSSSKLPDPVPTSFKDQIPIELIIPKSTSSWLLQYGGNIDARLWKNISDASRGAGVPLFTILSCIQYESVDSLGCSWRWIEKEVVEKANKEAAGIAKYDATLVNDYFPSRVIVSSEIQSIFSVNDDEAQKSCSKCNNEREPNDIHENEVIYLEPSTTSTPIPSFLVRLKIEMISLSLCLPQQWKNDATPVNSISTSSLVIQDKNTIISSTLSRRSTNSKHFKDTADESNIINVVDGVHSSQQNVLPVDLNEWRENVRKAEDCKILIDLIEQIDAAIPREKKWLAQWYISSPSACRNSSNSSTLSAAAVYLYTLDRALQWHSISELTKYRSKIFPKHHSFDNQCTLHPLCVELHGHLGRCVMARNGFSRVGPPLFQAPSPSPTHYQLQSFTSITQKLTIRALTNSAVTKDLFLSEMKNLNALLLHNEVLLHSLMKCTATYYTVFCSKSLHYLNVCDLSNKNTPFEKKIKILRHHPFFVHYATLRADMSDKYRFLKIESTYTDGRNVSPTTVYSLTNSRGEEIAEMMSQMHWICFFHICWVVCSFYENSAKTLNQPFSYTITKTTSGAISLPRITPFGKSTEVWLKCNNENSFADATQDPRNVLNYLILSFPVWISLSAMSGVYHPSIYDWVSPRITSILLSSSMLCMGMTIKSDDFMKIFHQPMPVAVGTVLQYTIMPLMGYLVSNIFLLPSAYSVGTRLVSSCPGGAASNLVTLIAKADVALSVLLTAASTILATFLTPVISAALIGGQVKVDGLQLMLSTAKIVFAPTIGGLLLSSFFERMCKVLSMYTPLFCTACISLIVGNAVAKNSQKILASNASLFLAIIAMHLGGFLFGYLSAKAAGLHDTACKTVSIEVGMQNSALAIVLAQQTFSDPAACVPGAISAVVHSLIGSVLSTFWRISHNRKNIASNLSVT